LITNIHETGEWPIDSIEVTMITLMKKMKATKSSNHCTISLITYTLKIVARIHRKRIERKIEDVLRKDQSGFRRGKGTRNAIGMLKRTS
jgi:hypothetical protein